MTKMLKDNAGYHWKHLLVSSEGTLAVVTRAVLRLGRCPALLRRRFLRFPPSTRRSRSFAGWTPRSLAARRRSS